MDGRKQISWEGKRVNYMGLTEIDKKEQTANTDDEFLNSRIYLEEAKNTNRLIDENRI